MYWLHPSWKQATCPYCGVNIWDNGGDPDWGACYDCFTKQNERAREQEYPPGPLCDICGKEEAVTGTNGYSVCSEHCHFKALERCKSK